MFAVVRTGGKQYKVQPGDTLRVEKLAANPGDKVQFDDVLMIGGDGPVVGSPVVDGAGVRAEVLAQVKGIKTINFVRRRRKGSSKRTKGHRQQLTLVRITEIVAPGAAAAGSGAPPGTAAKPAGRAAPGAAAAGGDLRRLPGVGPAIEKKLLGAGVTSVAQVATWTEEDAAALDEKLSLKGRIGRDGWVARARELAKG